MWQPYCGHITPAKEAPGKRVASAHPSALTKAAVPVEHSLQMNLPFGISESPRHCRWKAPQHCASHSSNSPGFSQICGERSTMAALSIPNSSKAATIHVLARAASTDPLWKSATFSLCQFIQVICASLLPFTIQSLLPHIC